VDATNFRGKAENTVYLKKKEIVDAKLGEVVA